MEVAFRVLTGRVLVQDTSSEEATTPGGIIIPGSTDIEENKARVIKVGDEASVEVDQIVSYRDDAGRLVRVGGVDYILIYEADIDGIYE